MEHSLITNFVKHLNIKGENKSEIEKILIDYISKSEGIFSLSPNYRNRILSVNSDKFLEDQIFNMLSMETINVIIGSAGTGKSYLIRKMFMKILENRMAMLPIFISLRSFIYQDIQKYIEKEVFNNLLDNNEVHDFLSKNKFILMLDGLDECINQIDIENIIIDFMLKYKNSIVVITSRHKMDSKLKNIKYIALNSSLEEGLNSINQNLYNEIMKENILKNPLLRDLLKSPLMVSLINKTFNRYDIIPDETGKIIDLFIHDILIYDDEINNRLNVSRKELIYIFAHLAYTLLLNDKDIFSMNDIKEIISKHKVNETEFLRYFPNTQLIYKEEDLFSFVHKSLQEYFAAIYIYNLDDDNKNIILNNIKDKNSQLGKLLEEYINSIDEKNFEESKESKTKGRHFRIIDRQDVDPVIEAKEIANEYSELIKRLKSEKGMMLGIFGNWGRGKTFLMDLIWKNLKEDNNPKYIRIDFHPWKYQDTPASWVYLYECFVNQYLESNKKYQVYVKNLKINLKSQGVSKLFIFLLYVGVAGISAIGLDKYLFTRVKAILIALGVGGFSTMTYICSKFKNSALKLFKEYSKNNNFTKYLGIQAEIQKELKILLDVWMKNKKNDKIILFVDDLDRCKEERIIEIIDSLRIMLEDEEILKKVIVVVAIDDRILKNVIKNKYSTLISEENKNNMMREYFDKLFISAVKLGSLKDSEILDLLNEYTKGKIDNSSNNNTDNKNINKKENNYGSENLISYEGNKSLNLSNDKNSVKAKDEATIAIEHDDKDSMTINNDYEITSSEYDILNKYIISIKDVTPRKIRIFYYRYLLGRNLLLDRLKKLNLIEKWTDDYQSIVLELMVRYTNDISLLQRESENLKTNEEMKLFDNEDKYDRQIIEEIIRIIDIVIAY
ncbi:P-loop NTPase fold protein [Tepidibacter hydrothermalis]|uniref:P-loop NTPase fold protein n=1 Tax=Tepidibacter hydrothermalis TaxID=3036126 RepID=A0ABY8EA59_9FIRM|nr:P-loop NTPase fold protein [Tepidibacter hydrothermalis]WFD09785.1 P-loop NTPase fold protein [Tepidibacter hydrothermalis]